MTATFLISCLKVFVLIACWRCPSFGRRLLIRSQKSYSEIFRYNYFYLMNVPTGSYFESQTAGTVWECREQSHFLLWTGKKVTKQIFMCELKIPHVVWDHTVWVCKVYSRLFKVEIRSTFIKFTCKYDGIRYKI